jgi:hypothetical protein
MANEFKIKNGALIGGTTGIGTDTPDPSSILDLTSTTQGFLLPRMTDTEMNSIASPVAGLMIWNTDSKLIWVYDGGLWQRVAFI